MRSSRIEQVFGGLAISSILLSSAVPQVHSGENPGTLPLVLNLDLTKGGIRRLRTDLRTFTPNSTCPAPVAFSSREIEAGFETPTRSTLAPRSAPDLAKQAQAIKAYGNLPLSFEANLGQVDSETRFLSRGGGYGVFLSSTEAVFCLGNSSSTKTKDRSLASHKSGADSNTLQSAVRMRLLGSNTASHIEGYDELPGKTNYFIGDDPEKWRTNIPNYAGVKYVDVYAGVDMFYHGDRRQLEYDFVVAPGADPGVIRLAFKGVRRARLDARGDLLLQATGRGEIRHKKPVIYQEIDGAKRYVRGCYVLNGKHELSFRVGKYDESKPLIIDPVLIYSTYLGGNGFETANGIAVDSAGNAYITGVTDSTDLPTANPLQQNFRGVNDAFVAKLNSTGTAPIYITYLGGNGNDQGQDIAVDAQGNAYVTGMTSGNFPTVNPLQANHGGGIDTFVAKLNTTGSALIYSTYLGGSRDDAGSDFNNDLAVDASGNVYVTGRTNSTDFPTVNPLQPTNHGSFDAFVVKINSAGSALIYSTYLGGSLNDAGYGVAVNATGSAYVTGATFSTDFPTVNPLDNTLAGSFDAFVAKLTPAGSALEYSTYLGGNDQEDGFGGDITVDALGFAYVTGSTGSTNFPTVNPLQPSNRGSHDIYVTKLSPDGAAIIFSTYLGGSGTDAATGIALDAEGNIYVTGFSSGTDFPTANPLDATRGGSSDAIVAKLNPTGSVILYSTYFGGNSQETGNAIAVDSGGNAYVVGGTNSIDLPTVNPMQPLLRGNQDCFVTKIFDSAAFSVEAIISNRGGNSGDVSVTVLGAGFQSGAAVKLKAANQPDIQAMNPGVINASRITATFDLRGASPGPRDVVVTLPDNSTATLHNGFTVEPGRAAQISVDIVARNTIRAGAPESFYIICRNRGNMNAYGIPLWIAGIPANATVNFGFERLRPLPARTGGAIVIDWAQIPTKLETMDGHLVIPLMIPVATPGASRIIRLDVTVPTLGTFFSIKAVLEKPFFQSPLNPDWAGCLKAFAENFRDRSAPVIDCELAIINLDQSDFSASEGILFFTDVLAAYLNVLVECGSEVSTFVLFETGVAPIVAERVEFLLDQPLNLYSSLRDDRCAGVLEAGWEAIKDNIRVVNSNDPNDKVGGIGAGSARYISAAEALPYAIYFENKPTATAPAQEVVITDPLDLSILDLSTFSFGPIAFGNKQVIPPQGLTDFAATVDLRPGMNLLVKISSHLDINTGLVTWRFSSVDPATGLPPEDPLAGFLPPGGEGNVVFTVSPKPNSLTGTVINNAASIVFDNNAALPTPTWSNTIDNSAPASSVHAITATPCSATVNVEWSGTDIGSSIRDYNIYVSDNGGPFVIWQSHTTVNSGTYIGQFGHTYGFYSVAQDNTGNIENAAASPDATVTLRAPTPPTFTSVPPAITVHSGQAATACGAVVSDAVLGTATAQSACSTVTVTRNGVPGGNLFPVGNTTITYTATDALGNTGSATQTVTILDNTPPTITCHANIVKANDPGRCSAVVTYASATATDNCSGVGAPSCSPASGSSFPKGTTTVTCTVADARGNQSSCSFTVTVVDTQLPVILCPANITVNNASNQCSAMVTYLAPTVTDNCPGATVVCLPPSGSTFPIGATTINCTATDSSGNTAICSFNVTVNDPRPPTITVRSNPITLWPPNHEYRRVNLTDCVLSARDLCDANVDINDVVIARVSSDEPENAPGDGNTLNDIVIAANCKSVQLRAERQGGGNGRVYTITFKVRDSSGNVATAICKVTVPPSQNGNPAIDDGPVYVVTGNCP